jgi:hypothetical protein
MASLRKWSLVFNLPCPKCKYNNDIDSDRRFQLVPSREIPNTVPVQFTEELLQIFCYKCAYKLEDFHPSDWVQPVVVNKP